MSEKFVRVGAYSEGGRNRGEGLIKFTRPEVYHMLTKSERVLNIPEKETAKLYFDSNVNRDGMKEGKVAKTAVRVKF